MLTTRVFLFVFAILFGFTQAFPAELEVDSAELAVREAKSDVGVLPDGDDIVQLYPDPSDDDDDTTEEEEEEETSIEKRACNTLCKIKNLVFNNSIGTFITNRNKKWSSPPLIWSSDGCSVPASVAKALHINKNKPLGYNFVNGCYRHDFGYRNYKKQKKFNESVRRQIDDNFKKDMYNVCKTYKGWSSWKGVQCRRVADAYHSMVRLCGGGSCTKKRILDILKKAILRL